jgi:hypothetical protein
MLTNLHNHLHRSLPNPTFYMTLKEFSNAGQNLVIIVNFLITLLELIPLAYNCLFINKVNPSMLYKITRFTLGKREKAINSEIWSKELHCQLVILVPKNKINSQ